MSSSKTTSKFVVPRIVEIDVPPDDEPSVKFNDGRRVVVDDWQIETITEAPGTWEGVVIAEEGATAVMPDGRRLAAADIILCSSIVLVEPDANTKKWLGRTIIMDDGLDRLRDPFVLRGLRPRGLRLDPVALADDDDDSVFNALYGEIVLVSGLGTPLADLAVAKMSDWAIKLLVVSDPRASAEAIADVVIDEVEDRYGQPERSS